jgi:Flp pilus assembly protein TadD
VEASEALLDRRYDDSVVLLDEGIHLEPEYPWAHIVRATTNMRLTNHEEAVEDLTSVLQSMPDDKAALLGRAIACGRLGKVDLACTDADKLCHLGDCSLRNSLRSHN